MVILQKGKEYKTRAGETIKIVKKLDNSSFLGNNKIIYGANGKFSQTAPQSIDLIEEM